MKTLKKRPTKQLEKYSFIFMQLSLVLVLFVVFQVLEYEIAQKPIAIVVPEVSFSEIYRVDENTVFVKEKKLKKITLKKSKTILLDLIKPTPDETFIDSPFLEEPIDKVEKEITSAFNTMVDDPNDLPIEDVDFFIIEDAPVFRGCEGLSKQENKKCFTKKIQQFVMTKFDIDLAQELGLRFGKHKIFTQFVIDKNGDITNVQVRAPHPRLKKEVFRIVNQLPKFTPGMQRKKPVNVKFTLPVTFYVN